MSQCLTPETTAGFIKLAQRHSPTEIPPKFIQGDGSSTKPDACGGQAPCALQPPGILCTSARSWRDTAMGAGRGAPGGHIGRGFRHWPCRQSCSRAGRSRKSSSPTARAPKQPAPEQCNPGGALLENTHPGQRRTGTGRSPGQDWDTFPGYPPAASTAPGAPAALHSAACRAARSRLHAQRHCETSTGSAAGTHSPGTDAANACLALCPCQKGPFLIGSGKVSEPRSPQLLASEGLGYPTASQPRLTCLDQTC